LPGTLVEMPGDYQLTELADGSKTLYSASYGEKMHPGLGPAAEADVLYVGQLKLRERMLAHSGEFVVWDVGLGAAANAIALLRSTRDVPASLRLVSFDNTSEPLAFALENAPALGYMAGYELAVASLLREGRVRFDNGRQQADWELRLGDFPAWLEREAPIRLGGAADEHGAALEIAGPDAIFYDAFSPAKNPAMWALPVFKNLFRALDPARPCALSTYTRSTMIRATLLLAGFFVGTGRATGLKEETTVAANRPDLIAEPLDARWLARAERSDSAEPLDGPVYTRKPLLPDNLKRIRLHPQFSRAAAFSARA